MFSYLSLENFSCFAKFELQSITKINIFIGANDTGKTHLIKLLYTITKSIEEFTKRTESDQPDWREVLAEKLFWVYQPESNKLGQLVKKGESRLKVNTRLLDENYYFAFGKNTARKITDCTELAPTQPGLNALFIPPKEVLTALDAIATINEQLQIFGFDHTYKGQEICSELPLSCRTFPSKPKKLKIVSRWTQLKLTVEIRQQATGNRQQ